MAITDDLLDQLIKDYKKPEDLIGENGLLKQLTKRLLEKAMQAEMTDHLGYAKNAPAGNNTGNSRNGSYKKKAPFPVTAMPALIRPSSPRVRAVSKASTIRLSPCTPGG